jgi:hypothetical protein
MSENTPCFWITTVGELCVLLPEQQQQKLRRPMSPEPSPRSNSMFCAQVERGKGLWASEQYSLPSVEAELFYKTTGLPPLQTARNAVLRHAATRITQLSSA